MATLFLDILYILLNKHYYFQNLLLIVIAVLVGIMNSVEISLFTAKNQPLSIVIRTSTICQVEKGTVNRSQRKRDTLLSDLSYIVLIITDNSQQTES